MEVSKNLVEEEAKVKV